MGPIYQDAWDSSGLVSLTAQSSSLGTDRLFYLRLTRSYNWASSKNEKANHPEVNYVPMLHGKAIPGVDDKPALFEINKAKFKEWGVTHILSFNEPDVSQSC